MATTVTHTVHPLVALACQYADDVIGSLNSVYTEQELREGLVGAFLVFMQEGLDLAERETRCRRTGTPGG